jgi:peptidoglycan-associated lipoprotein
MNRASRVCLALGVAAFLTSAACGKKQPQTAPPPPAPPPPAADPTPPPPPPPPTPPPTAAPTPLTDDEAFARKSLEDLNKEQPLADVFFDYDSADLSETARTTLQKNSAWLKRWTSTKVTVEGHADARGTNEYNLALGERRAASVRDYLNGLGLTGDRIAMVTKGEEQPVCQEQTEACWSRNRRGRFIITAK